MKKIRIGLSLVFLFVIFCSPFMVQAKTISEFEAEVEKFTKDLEEKQNQINLNDQEVAKIEENIKNIQSQISSLESEMSTLEDEIARSNQEIEQKSQESKELFQYLQISEGENAYMEYIFGATDITDMVYRMAIVEQLTEYNNQVMEELAQLVEQNKTRKDELDKKQVELESLTEELESEQDRINADSQAIREAMPSVEQQLKEAKENLEYYQSLGCGATEDIVSCQVRYDRAHASSSSGSGSNMILPPSVSGFYRPMESGYVTQNWMNAGHLGMDMSNTDKTIEIHPIATGVVFKKYYDNAGALVLKIRHNVNGTYLYSTYAHLSAWYVNEGDLVTPDTVIGRMGNTGYSFGAHLHLEITTCDWNRGGGCTWYEYQNSTINPRQYIGFPSSLRVWWYGR